MPEQSSNCYYVGRRVLIEDEEWMITACNFIFDTGTLRRVVDIHNPQVGYQGESRTLAFSKIPLGKQSSSRELSPM
jgi:hypothetical protein